MKIQFLLLTIWLFAFVDQTTLFAQGPNREDYLRAVSFLWNNLNNKKVFNASVQPVWFGDSTGVGWVTQDKSGKYFNKVVFKEGTAKPWFDQEKLAGLISETTKAEIKSADLPIMPVSADATSMKFRMKGKPYEINLAPGN